MGIESFLNAESKIEALQELKMLIAKEIYIKCITLGLDPDEFDHTEYVASFEQSSPTAVGVNQNYLLGLCKKMLIVESKIGAL